MSQISVRFPAAIGTGPEWCDVPVGIILIIGRIIKSIRYDGTISIKGNPGPTGGLET